MRSQRRLQCACPLRKRVPAVSRLGSLGGQADAQPKGGAMVTITLSIGKVVITVVLPPEVVVATTILGSWIG